MDPRYKYKDVGRNPGHPDVGDVYLGKASEPLRNQSRGHKFVRGQKGIRPFHFSDRLAYRMNMINRDTPEGREKNKRFSQAINKRVVSYLKTRSPKRIPESTDMVSEISQKTLLNYSNRAAYDSSKMRSKESISQYLNRRRKRHQGMAQAMDKMTKHGMKEETSPLDEVLSPTASIHTWIKDFQQSDAPQFKGKSLEKRRQMAIAAKLSSMRKHSERKKQLNLFGESDEQNITEKENNLSDACWTGYTAIGMKMKKGRRVPNCVPKEQVEPVSEGDMPSYNKQSVDTAIKKAKVGKKEANLIHRLLKGRHSSTTMKGGVPKPDKDRFILPESEQPMRSYKDVFEAELRATGKSLQQMTDKEQHEFFATVDHKLNS